MPIEYKSKKYEGTKEELLCHLKKRDPEEYDRYIRELIIHGNNLARIREYIIEEEAQKILKESFLLKFEFYIHDNNGPEEIIKYINNWKKSKTGKDFTLPVDMNHYLELPEVEELMLREIAIRREYDKRYKANSLDRFIKIWDKIRMKIG